MADPRQPMELLLSVDRDAGGTLGAQVEGQLRRAIRTGALRAGTRLPSTRDLAGQLGISRRITVDAYSQLAAEGYLVVRQGARTRVAKVATAPSFAPAVARGPRPTAPGTTSARAGPTWLRSRVASGCAACAKPSAP